MGAILSILNKQTPITTNINQASLSPSKTSSESPQTIKEMSAEEIEVVEQCLGYKFNDRSLASEALTHPSFYPRCTKTSPTYDRLEFVGDAVLNLLVAREVFNTYPKLHSGPLSKLRAVNVDTEKFARIAIKHSLHRHVRHRAPCLEGQIKQFVESYVEYPVHSYGLLDPPKVLADIVESLLGAVFLDSKSSLETVWKVFKRLAEPLINEETIGKHPVTELLELCQKRRIRLRFLKDSWKVNTMVKVVINDRLVGSATYAIKKEIALNRAAKDALDKLKELLPELDATLDEQKEHSPVLDSSLKEESRKLASSLKKESTELDASLDKELPELDSSLDKESPVPDSALDMDSPELDATPPSLAE